MTIAAVGSQEGGANGDDSASVSRAFGSNVTAGNLIVVGCVRWHSDTSDPFTAGHCTKSAGTATLGTIQLDGEIEVAIGGTQQLAAGIWSAIVTGSGSCTMQVTAPAHSYTGIGTGEYSSTLGWDSNRLESYNENGTATDGVATLGTGNASSTGGALFFAVGGPTGNLATTITQDGAFTVVYEEEDGVTHGFANICRQIVSTATTDSGDWTMGTGTGVIGWATNLAVYKESFNPSKLSRVTLVAATRASFF